MEAGTSSPMSNLDIAHHTRSATGTPFQGGAQLYTEDNMQYVRPDLRLPSATNASSSRAGDKRAPRNAQANRQSRNGQLTTPNTIADYKSETTSQASSVDVSSDASRNMSKAAAANNADRKQSPSSNAAPRAGLSRNRVTQDGHVDRRQLNGKTGTEKEHAAAKLGVPAHSKPRTNQGNNDDGGSDASSLPSSRNGRPRITQEGHVDRRHLNNKSPAAKQRLAAKLNVSASEGASSARSASDTTSDEEAQFSDSSMSDVSPPRLTQDGHVDRRQLNGKRGAEKKHVAEKLGLPVHGKSGAVSSDSASYAESASDASSLPSARQGRPRITQEGHVDRRHLNNKSPAAKQRLASKLGVESGMSEAVSTPGSMSDYKSGEGANAKHRSSGSATKPRLTQDGHVDRRQLNGKSGAEKKHAAEKLGLPVHGKSGAVSSASGSNDDASDASSLPSARNGRPRITQEGHIDRRHLNNKSPAAKHRLASKLGVPSGASEGASTPGSMSDYKSDGGAYAKHQSRAGNNQPRLTQDGHVDRRQLNGKSGAEKKHAAEKLGLPVHGKSGAVSSASGSNDDASDASSLPSARNGRPRITQEGHVDRRHLNNKSPAAKHRLASKLGVESGASEGFSTPGSMSDYKSDDGYSAKNESNAGQGLRITLDGHLDGRQLNGKHGAEKKREAEKLGVPVHGKSGAVSSASGSNDDCSDASSLPSARNGRPRITQEGHIDRRHLNNKSPAAKHRLASKLGVSESNASEGASTPGSMSDYKEHHGANAAHRSKGRIEQPRLTQDGHVDRRQLNGKTGEEKKEAAAELGISTDAGSKTPSAVQSKSVRVGKTRNSDVKAQTQVNRATTRPVASTPATSNIAYDNAKPGSKMQKASASKSNTAAKKSPTKRKTPENNRKKTTKQPNQYQRGEVASDAETSNSGLSSEASDSTRSSNGAGRAADSSASSNAGQNPKAPTKGVEPPQLREYREKHGPTNPEGYNGQSTQRKSGGRSEQQKTNKNSSKTGEEPKQLRDHREKSGPYASNTGRKHEGRNKNYENEKTGEEPPQLREYREKHGPSNPEGYNGSTGPRKTAQDKSRNKNNSDNDSNSDASATSMTSSPTGRAAQNGNKGNAHRAHRNDARSKARSQMSSGPYAARPKTSTNELRAHGTVYEIDTVVTKEPASTHARARNRELTVRKSDPDLSPSVQKIIQTADKYMGHHDSNHDDDVYHIQEYVDTTSDGTSEGTSAVSDYAGGGRDNDLGIVERVKNFLQM